MFCIVFTAVCLLIALIKTIIIIIIINFPSVTANFRQNSERQLYGPNFRQSAENFNRLLNLSKIGSLQPQMLHF